MSLEAFLPCFKCGKRLRNAFVEADNHPSEGTEFRTYGHYGSTVWDSFDGEELVLNVCDPCLREHADRLAQQKRFLPVSCEGFSIGRRWVDRPMVGYTGNEDDEKFVVEIEDIGITRNVEWATNIDEVKAYLSKKVEEEESTCES